MKVAFYKHNLSQEDKDYCMQVLDGEFLTTGAVTKEFETKLADYLGAKHAIGVTSCTSALFLALRCIGVEEGDEVITSPMTFIASGNVIEHCGAKPVLVDCEASTGNIDANLIEAAITPKTKAIIAVHLYGQMCDMKAIHAIAQKHNIKVIEDAAHCVEGKRDGVGVGELADFACFSFYATKNLTCGEGGAVSFNNDEYLDYMMQARLHGMSKSAADRYVAKYQHYDMELLGYKMNLSNIQASLMVKQLDRLEGYLQQKEAIAKRYDAGFANNPNISTPAVLPDSKHARHLYTVWVDPEKRDEIMHQLQDRGIGVAVNFRPMHVYTYYIEKYGYKEGDYPNAEKIGASTITLPFYPRLTNEEVDYVIDTLNEITG